MYLQVMALTIVASKSLAKRRLRLSQARARSTTHRRGSSSKPQALVARLTISIVKRLKSLGSRFRGNDGIAFGVSEANWITASFAGATVVR